MRTRICVFVLVSVVLSGCGTANGPLSGRSIQIDGAFGSFALSESRHRTQPIDVYLSCRAAKEPKACEAEARRAMAFTCVAEAMPPISYALCLRCVLRPDPDDAECSKLAASIAATPDASISVIPGVRPFTPDGTADPPNHPPVGPMPPLR